MTIRLTPAETAILRGLLAGKRLVEIAEERHRSVKTVQFQVQVLRLKAGVANNAQLGCWAARAGVAP